MKNQIQENNRMKEGFKDSFSTAEKIFMQVSFSVFVLFGIVGVFVENWIARVDLPPKVIPIFKLVFGQSACPAPCL